MWRRHSATAGRRSAERCIAKIIPSQINALLVEVDA
jgi:hypothetical protein